jgi:ankyrin repeat protein
MRFAPLVAVELLIKSASQATPDRALISRAARGDEATVKALLVRGADATFAVSAEGFTALMSAAALEQPQPDLVKSPIEHGADVNARSREGMSVLDIALRQGGTAVVDATLAEVPCWRRSGLMKLVKTGE